MRQKQTKHQRGVRLALFFFFLRKVCVSVCLWQRVCDSVYGQKNHQHFILSLHMVKEKGMSVSMNYKSCSSQTLLDCLR